MNIYQRAGDFLQRHEWTVVQQNELGTTAHIIIVERQKRRAVFKIQRNGLSNRTALFREYQVLRYLTTTPMHLHIPSVGNWIEDLNGFFMDYMHPPALVTQDATLWAWKIAGTLRTLHRIPLPPEEIVEDDRPHIGLAMCHRFQNIFQYILKGKTFWNNVSQEEVALLEVVRSKYADYSGLLPMLQEMLGQTPIALTHGDLSGDNITLTQNAQIALIDWGSARISAAISDVAALLIYMNWSEPIKQLFLQVYFGHNAQELAQAVPCLDVLSQLYRYRSCVQSLLWLNEEEGLDAVGKAHFERMPSSLE